MAETNATRRARPPLWAAFSEPLLVARPFRVLELRLCILPLLSPASRERHQRRSLPTVPKKRESTTTVTPGEPGGVLEYPRSWE